MADQKIELTDELVSTVAAKVFDKIGKSTDFPSRKVFSDTKLQEKYSSGRMCMISNPGWARQPIIMVFSLSPFQKENTTLYFPSLVTRQSTR